MSLWGGHSRPAGAREKFQRRTVSFAAFSVRKRRTCLNPHQISGVSLIDEPTSALDPKSTEAIEELILRLREKRTIVVVTHNLQQARRVAQRVACICVRGGTGELGEIGGVDDVFTRPCCADMAAYLSTATI